MSGQAYGMGTEWGKGGKAVGLGGMRGNVEKRGNVGMGECDTGSL